jgi:hypothetical protein
MEVPMTNLSTCADPARPLPHVLERVEGDSTTLQVLSRHHEALERQAASVASDTLRRLMGMELAGATSALRRFVVVREDSPPLLD